MHLSIINYLTILCFKLTDNEPCPDAHAATQEAHYCYKIIPLIEGYSNNIGPGKQLATGSSTLVKGLKNVIVDTGNPTEKDKLLR